MKDWVVDVCILDTVEKIEESALSCVAFLYLQSKKREFICLDSDGEILSLYESHVNLHNPSDLIGRWWKLVTHNDLARIIYAQLPKKVEDALLGMEFHNDDLIFVRVASKSRSKRIVSVNSDFGCSPASQKNREDVKKFLESLKIHTHTPEEAISDLSK